MGDLIAVYLESLDQDLRVFKDDENAAMARFEELKQAGKPVNTQKFNDSMITGVAKSNGTSASDPGFWEELRYDNGTCTLVVHYSWHSDPDPEGYYPDYQLLMNP